MEEEKWLKRWVKIGIAGISLGLVLVRAAADLGQGQPGEQLMKTNEAAYKLVAGAAEEQWGVINLITFILRKEDNSTIAHKAAVIWPKENQEVLECKITGPGGNGTAEKDQKYNLFYSNTREHDNEAPNIELLVRMNKDNQRTVIKRIEGAKVIGSAGAVKAYVVFIADRERLGGK
ncbi:hypothetical protein NEHOM01_2259 [Nematocida homosporus]|uniref:uncharacterized protein n=1 Tax=Nematocida homosporus TaxID=1912981 RepID=UPI002220DD19|nr:uncharacterized protein NEHOM01_2259 [Nematocida homosporus]KAI5187544.1 hypothetical protein NEHOM01_2259 [Nematocida homosporus]